MKDNDYSSDEADGTTQLAQGSKLLLQEIGPQDGTDKDTQGSEGCNENRGGKGVSSEVANFSDTNYA